MNNKSDAVVVTKTKLTMQPYVAGHVPSKKVTIRI